MKNWDSVIKSANILDMQRIFIESHQIHENHLTVDDETAHHLFNVCRLTEQSFLDVIVNQDRQYHIKILKIQNNTIEFTIIDQWSLNNEYSRTISLVQSIPKQDKFTDICRMCTEVGVAHFFPVVSEFCDIKDLSVNKIKRATKAIDSAAKQSKQIRIPELHPALSLADVLTKNKEHFKSATCLIADEGTTEKLHTKLKSVKDHIVLAIGPEGGFSHIDRELLLTAGFVSFSLGKSILRTEHAGFAAINFINATIEVLNNNTY